MIGFQVFAGVTTVGRPMDGDFAADPISTLTLKQPSAEWGIPTGADRTPPRLTSPFDTISVINSVLADLNGDGKLDLAIPEADGVTVFPNPGNGVFVQGSGVFTRARARRTASIWWPATSTTTARSIWPPARITSLFG